MTTIVRPMFPHVVDSTMMAAFRSCPRKFYLMYLLHWKAKEESVDLHAGAAFAAAMEAARKAFFVEKMPRKEAEAEGMRTLMKSYGDFECPASSPKTFDRMCGALEFYYSEYPLGLDGATPIIFAGNRSGIELSFARPLEHLHPYTQDPILYVGRMDMVAEFSNAIYLFDEKTTTRLGQTWASQWEHRSQFTSYCWGAAGYGPTPAGVIVRGVSILKTKYETQQVLTYRAQWEIDRWLEQVHRDLRRMQQSWEEMYFDYNLDHSCCEYRGCLFKNVCKSENPLPWLEMFCTQRVWDPMQRKQLTVEEYEAQWQ